MLIQILKRQNVEVEILKVDGGFAVRSSSEIKGLKERIPLDDDCVIDAWWKINHLNINWRVNKQGITFIL